MARDNRPIGRCRRNHKKSKRKFIKRCQAIAQSMLDRNVSSDEWHETRQALIAEAQARGF